MSTNEDAAKAEISHHGTRDFLERNHVENEAYALVFPILAKYETRGFNAHQRAQNLVRKLADDMSEFVRQNTRGQ